MSNALSKEDKAKLEAAIDFIRRTGAKQIQMRWSDNEQPVIFMAVAIYDGNNPMKAKGAQVEAALNPVFAALRLCEKLADGGQCQHCLRPVGLEPNLLTRMPFDDIICWYQFDPELKVFRRGCEGQT